MKIPIKKYTDNPELSWEERYKKLEAHHKKETEWLISEATKIKGQLERTKYLLQVIFGELKFQLKGYEPKSDTMVKLWNEIKEVLK